MNPKHGQIQGSFYGHEGKIEMRLPFIAFEEDGSQIVYCPALDISGYGNNEVEANESFTTSLEAFFLYTINKKTFKEELHRLGWKTKNKNKPMTPPDMSKLLSENDNFNRIFNTHPFRKYDQQIEIPIS